MNLTPLDAALTLQALVATRIGDQTLQRLATAAILCTDGALDKDAIRGAIHAFGGDPAIRAVLLSTHNALFTDDTRDNAVLAARAEAVLDGNGDAAHLCAELDSHADRLAKGFRSLCIGSDDSPARLLLTAAALAALAKALRIVALAPRERVR